MFIPRSSLLILTPRSIVECFCFVYIGDGGISYGEFKELMYDKMYEGTVDEDLLGCFKIFDINGDGYISPLEVQELFKKLGEMITVEEAVDIMTDCDLNKDGLIDFDGKLWYLYYHTSLFLLWISSDDK